MGGNNLRRFVLSLIVGLFFMYPIIFMPSWAGYGWAIIILAIWKMFKVEYD